MLMFRCVDVLSCLCFDVFMYCYSYVLLCICFNMFMFGFCNVYGRVANCDFSDDKS